MVGVLEGSQLSFQKDRLVLPDRLFQIFADIADIGRNHIAVAVNGLQKFLPVNRVCVIEVGQQNVLLHTDALDLLHQCVVVHEQFIDLPADLSIFVGIKGCDS